MLMKSQADKIFPGGQKFLAKIFNTTAENFCSRMKFFGGENVFLDRPCVEL